MIAPSSAPKAKALRTPLDEARRAAAELLPERENTRDGGAGVPAWKAWLFATWVVMAGTAYLLSMLGWWK